ncbi:MAG: Epimerase family protein [Acidobacteria bacterium ADurb.Bin051]|nr:MAG: Epimerase family protein [Acidobacteria bacterium ADurb.Bin051]
MRFLLGRPDLSGPFLLASPAPVRNRELARTLGRILRRPAVLPVPAFVLRLLFGAMSELVLTGQRVRPERLLAAGFTFRFPDLAGALADLLGRPPRGGGAA